MMKTCRLCEHYHDSSLSVYIGALKGFKLSQEVIARFLWKYYYGDSINHMACVSCVGLELL